jgi:hypothetical protein
VKKSQLKQLIREISDNLAKDPNYIAGYRLGEDSGYTGEDALGVKLKPKIFQMGYRNGYWAGWRKRWNEKLTQKIVSIGRNFGDDNFHRKFEGVSKTTDPKISYQIQLLIPSLKQIYREPVEHESVVYQGYDTFKATHSINIMPEENITRWAKLYTKDFVAFTLQINYNGKVLNWENIDKKQVFDMLAAHSRYYRKQEVRASA